MQEKYLEVQVTNISGLNKKINYWRYLIMIGEFIGSVACIVVAILVYFGIVIFVPKLFRK